MEVNMANGKNLQLQLHYKLVNWIIQYINKNFYLLKARIIVYQSKLGKLYKLNQILKTKIEYKITKNYVKQLL